MIYHDNSMLKSMSHYFCPIKHVVNHSDSRDLAFKCVSLPTESGKVPPDLRHKRDRRYKTYHLHMYQEPKVNNSST